MGCKNVEEETGRKKETGFFKNSSVNSNVQVNSEVSRPSLKSRFGATGAISNAARSGSASRYSGGVK